MGANSSLPINQQQFDELLQQYIDFKNKTIAFSNDLNHRIDKTNEDNINAHNNLFERVEELIAKFKTLENENKQLKDDNIHLKNSLKSLETKLDIQQGEINDLYNFLNKLIQIKNIKK